MCLAFRVEGGMWTRPDFILELTPGGGRNENLPPVRKNENMLVRVGGREEYGRIGRVAMPIKGMRRALYRLRLRRGGFPLPQPAWVLPLLHGAVSVLATDAAADVSGPVQEHCERVCETNNALREGVSLPPRGAAPARSGIYARSLSRIPQPTLLRSTFSTMLSDQCVGRGSAPQCRRVLQSSPIARKRSWCCPPTPS